MALIGRGSRMTSSLHGGGDRPPFEGIYIYLLTVLLGYVISDLSLLKIRPMMLPTEPPASFAPQAQPQMPTARDVYTVVTQRNLFNADGIIPPPISAKGGEGTTDENAPAVLSQLPLKLEGTIVHLNPKRSVASITIQAKNEVKAFMNEDEIENLARITKIERRKVTFRNLNNNRLEYIEIPKDSALSFIKNVESTETSDGGISKQGEFEFSVRREDLNKYTSDLASILNQARMVPNILPGSGGRVDGFRFVSIQPNSIYEKLGFRMGDVIKEVNGEMVNSPTKAMELYNALRSDNRIRLRVERDGRDENFSYDVKD